MKTLEERVLGGQGIQQAINNLNKCYKKRDSRIKRRLEKLLLCEYVYFITFTIAPEHYGYEYQTYLRKIKKALNNALGWVLNSDYGDENGRLHFHAVASFNGQLDYNTIISIYQYGSVNFKFIYSKNEKAIREYLVKTLNHATKQSVGKIHYSRVKCRCEKIRGSKHEKTMA